MALACLKGHDARDALAIGVKFLNLTSNCSSKPIACKRVRCWNKELKLANYPTLVRPQIGVTLEANRRYAPACRKESAFEKGTLLTTR